MLKNIIKTFEEHRQQHQDESIQHNKDQKTIDLINYIKTTISIELEKIKQFLDEGANIDGHTTIYLKELGIKSGTNLQNFNFFAKESPLVSAIEVGETAAVSYLVNRGASLNARTSNGHSPITMAEMCLNIATLNPHCYARNPVAMNVNDYRIKKYSQNTSQAEAIKKYEIIDQFLKQILADQKQEKENRQYILAMREIAMALGQGLRTENCVIAKTPLPILSEITQLALQDKYPKKPFSYSDNYAMFLKFATNPNRLPKTESEKSEEQGYITALSKKRN